MRILHLIEPDSPDGGPARRRLLADVIAGLPDHTHDVLSLNRSRGIGIRTAGALGAASTAPLTGFRPLRRLLRTAEAAGRGPDLLHGWSATAAALLGLAAPGRPRVATCSTMPANRNRRAVLDVLLRRYPLAALTGLGSDALPLLPANARGVLTAAVDVAAIDHPARAALREGWEIADDSFVVGVIGERARDIDARDAAAILNRLGTTDRDIRVLVSPRARHRADAVRWLRWTRFADRLIEDARADEPWRIAAGLDAAVVIRRHGAPPVMPIAWAMAAGLPVVAETGSDAELLVEPGDTNGACDRLLRLHDDPTTARRIGARAQDRAAREHGIERLCHELGAVYATVA